MNDKIIDNSSSEDDSFDFFKALNAMNELNDDSGENKIVTADDVDSYYDVVTDEEVSEFRKILANLENANEISEEINSLTDDDIREYLIGVKSNLNSASSLDYDNMSEEEKRDFDAKNDYVLSKQEEILASMNKPIDVSLDTFTEKEMYEYFQKCMEAIEEYERLKNK